MSKCYCTLMLNRKMYQDYIIQYNNILKQHQEKYSETALSQEYYMKKKDLEEIENRVLKHSEQFKSKEAALLDMLGTSITISIAVKYVLHCKIKALHKH